MVRLNDVAALLGILCLVVAAFVLVVLLVRYFTGHSKNPDGAAQFVKGHTSVNGAINGVKILTVAVTVVVVVVPEGHPLAVTSTIEGSPHSKQWDQQPQYAVMNVVDAYVGGKKMVPLEDVDMLSSTASALLIEGIAQNTTGNVFETEDGGAIEVTGSPTEEAILSWGVRLGMRFNDARSKSSILNVFPFNSEKKRGGVAVEVGGSEVHISLERGC